MTAKRQLAIDISFPGKARTRLNISLLPLQGLIDAREQAETSSNNDLPTEGAPLPCDDIAPNPAAFQTDQKPVKENCQDHMPRKSTQDSIPVAIAFGEEAGSRQVRFRCDQVSREPSAVSQEGVEL